MKGQLIYSFLFITSLISFICSCSGTPYSAGNLGTPPCVFLLNRPEDSDLFYENRDSFFIEYPQFKYAEYVYSEGDSNINLVPIFLEQENIVIVLVCKGNIAVQGSTELWQKDAALENHAYSDTAACKLFEQQVLPSIEKFILGIK